MHFTYFSLKFGFCTQPCQLFHETDTTILKSSKLRKKFCKVLVRIKMISRCKYTCTTRFIYRVTTSGGDSYVHVRAWLRILI